MINNVFVLSGAQDLLDIKASNNILSIVSPCKTSFHLPISPPTSNEVFTTLQSKYHDAISKLVSKRNRLKKCSSVRKRQSIDITKMLNDTLTIATTPLKLKVNDQEKLLLSISKSKMKSMGHRSSKLPIKNKLSSSHNSKNINEIFASHFNSNQNILNLTQATPGVKCQRSKISLLDRNDDDNIQNNQNINNSANLISSAIINKRAISKNLHDFSSNNLQISDNNQSSSSIIKPSNNSSIKISAATSTLLSPKLTQQFDSSKKKLPNESKGIESIDCFSPVKFQLQPKSVPNTPVLLMQSPVPLINTTPRMTQLMHINSMEGLNELKNSTTITTPGTPVNLTSEKMKALLNSMRKADKCKQCIPSKQFMSNSPKKNFNNSTPIKIQSFDHEFDFGFSNTTVPLTSNPIQSFDHRFDFGFGFTNTTVPFTTNPMSLSPKPTRSSLSNPTVPSIVKENSKNLIEENSIDVINSCININTKLNISTSFDEDLTSPTEKLTYSADDRSFIKDNYNDVNCFTEDISCSPMEVISSSPMNVIADNSIIEHIEQVQDDIILPKLLFSNNSPVPMEIVDENIIITPTLEDIQYNILSFDDNQCNNEDHYIPFPDIEDSLTEESPLILKKQLSKTPTSHTKLLNSGSARRIIHNINTPDKSMTSIDIAIHKSSLSKGPRRLMKATPMKTNDTISKDHQHLHSSSDDNIAIEPPYLKSPCIKSSVSVANLIKKFQPEKSQSEVIHKTTAISSSIKIKALPVEEKSHTNISSSSISESKSSLLSTKTPINVTKTSLKTAGKSTKSKVRFAGIPNTPQSTAKKPEEEESIENNLLLEITPLKNTKLQKPMNITRTRSSVRLQRRLTISNDESVTTGLEHSIKDDVNNTLLTNVHNEITTPLIEIKKQPNSSNKLQRRQSCSNSAAAMIIKATPLSKSIMNLLNDVQENIILQENNVHNKENNQHSFSTITKIDNMISSTPNISVSVVKAKRIKREKHLDELFGSCNELLHMIDHSVAGSNSSNNNDM